MTNGDWLKEQADKQAIPPRTLEQVQAALAAAKLKGSDDIMARMMLNTGRLTDEARAWVAKEYPQGK